MKLKTLVLTNTDVHKYEGLAQAIVDSRGRLDLSNRLWFVIWNGRDWLSYGGYREIDSERVYFGPTFVKEEFRGIGLQRKMIRVRLKRAKKDGYSEAVSSIFTFNHWSGNNLIAEGFRLAPIPRYYDIEVDEVWFKKLL